MSTAVEVYRQSRGIVDYQAQPKETVEECNLCGMGDSFRYESRVDRYGFAQIGMRCDRCGLRFLNPRMTREAYARFYETAYRPLVSAFHGREINAQTIQEEQREYGKRLATLLIPHLREWRASTLLDVGGSTGIVAHTLAAVFQLHPTVLEPSGEAVEAGKPMEHHAPDGTVSNVYGEVIRKTVEDFNPRDRRWDLVTMCQTADHLLDLMGSLKKIRGLLSEGGLFWSDIVDFDKTREVKIDHPFNLTERTYREFLERAGFQLLQMNYAPDGVHIGFLCRSAA